MIPRPPINIRWKGQGHRVTKCKSIAARILEAWNCHAVGPWLFLYTPSCSRIRLGNRMAGVTSIECRSSRSSVCDLCRWSTCRGFVNERLRQHQQQQQRRPLSCGRKCFCRWKAATCTSTRRRPWVICIFHPQCIAVGQPTRPTQPFILTGSING